MFGFWELERNSLSVLCILGCEVCCVLLANVSSRLYIEMKVEVNPYRWKPKCGLTPGSETNFMVSASQQHSVWSRGLLKYPQGYHALVTFAEMRKIHSKNRSWKEEKGSLRSCVPSVWLHVGEKRLVVFSSRVLVTWKAHENGSLPRIGPGCFQKSSFVWYFYNLKCSC